MHYSFELDTIKGNIYKRVLERLCDISDIVYFRINTDVMINDRIFELKQQCKVVDVPRIIREHSSGSVIGYKINIFIRMYLFEKNSLYDLFGDLTDMAYEEYGAMMFYNGAKEMAHILLDDWDGCIHIYTDDVDLIRELSRL